MFVPPPPPPPLHGAQQHTSLPRGEGNAPPPPPPQSMLVDASRFKVVAGLGDALRQAKLKISGVEETPACAEGVATGGRTTTRPTSWHGGGHAPKKNRAIIDEMQNKLAARRAKIDKECEPTASATKPPPRPVSCVEVGRRGTAPPSRGYTPPTDYGPARRTSMDYGPARRTPTDFGADWSTVIERKYSHDSGQYSREQSWTPPINANSYRRVSLDQERKEELSLAKQVRQTSVKILRMSPATVGQDEGVSKLEKPDFSVPAVTIPPPSPIALRYWKQCRAEEESQQRPEQGELKQDTGGASSSNWRSEAMEGEVTEFPSIKDKISTLEEEVKTKMVIKVPNVRKNLNLGETKTAGWMEARLKLQEQLDSLLSRTTIKLSNCSKTDPEEPKVEETKDIPNSYPEVDSHVKSLIKSVANEIQKSFSQKNLNIDEQDGEELDEEETKEQSKDEDSNTTVDNAIFTLALEDLVQEAPIDFSSTPVILDNSFSRERLSIVKKSSRERRLPASIVAKKKAAEKLKNIIVSTTQSAENESNSIILNTSLEALFEPENISDEDNAEKLAREMSKLEHSQVLQILQTVEKGILEFSIPLLIPFLSLQVKLLLSKNIYNELDIQNKTELVKESIIDSLVNDITDIAILQEVIERSQERLNSLKDEGPSKESGTQCDTYEMKDASTLTDLEDGQNSNTNIIVSSSSPNNTQSDNLETIELKIDTSSIRPNKEDKSLILNETSPAYVEYSESTKKLEENERSEDSGVDVEESNIEETLSNCKSEKNIKTAIMNILNDAKAQENTRNVRNYGRNFELQQVQLSPVINDRRPMKARKMDSMWNNQIAAKTGNINGITVSKPPARVPWTMKDNASIIKKDSILYNNEVEEFEKCRSTLVTNKSSAISSKAKTSITESITKTNKENMKENLGVEPRGKEGKGDRKLEESAKELNKVDLKTKVEEGAEKNNINEKNKAATKIPEKVTIEEINVAAEEFKIENNSVQEEAVSVLEPTLEVIDLSVSESASTEKIGRNTSLLKDVQREIKLSEETYADISTEISSSDSEWEESESEAELSFSESSEKLLKNTFETKTKTNLEKINSSSNTPVVRRRMETTAVPLTSVTGSRLPPPPVSRLPPPPVSRPPPPPMSPPVVSLKIQKILDTTTSRFETLQNEVFAKNVLCRQEENIVDMNTIEKKVDEDEESEWEEWTEEETDDEEVRDEQPTEEKWGNILSNSDGPTTFTAEFCIRLL